MERRDERITSFLKERIIAGDFPSAVYLVGEGGQAVLADALGDAVRAPVRSAATLETIYDLASLTKPFVTGLLCARLVEHGGLKLETLVADVLPEFDQPDKSAITVRQLLTHSSGLPAWRPLYMISGGDPGNVLRTIVAQPLEYRPGTHVIYSDLGFITLGLLLERLEGASLAEIARRRIFEPLELKRTLFNPGEEMRESVAASETGNCHEREKCGDEPAASAFTNWREHLIWGEVHDGNAHFLGGVAGHAGLFSTAREVLRIATQFVASHTRLLSPQTCRLFQVDMTPGLEEARSFAWQLAVTKDSTAGPKLPPSSFGHLGFTGTSCWIDAEHDRVFILLTNRTHARPLPFKIINDVRRRFHTLAVEALDSK
jgi:CubicO group peptidase (beta-lactamase class C family)